MSETILSFEDALALVLAHAAQLSGKHSQHAPLLDAAGRTLAEPIHADRDQPPFDRSTRDGFAIRAADETAPRRVIGSLRAGESWVHAPLAKDEAIEIMTGAPLPAGADAVIMLEHVTHAGDTLEFHPGRTIRPFENVVPRGAEARAQAAIVPAGTLITPAEIALAASCGDATLPVFIKPKVAIIATGDELVELVELNSPVQDWQIRNSNSYALAALTAAEGAEPHRLPIARDTLADVRQRIAEGRKADLLVLSGGVSKGKFDLVEQVLTELGAEFFFTGALIQPGRPVVFGRLPATPTDPACYFFGLPGNPVSTQVTFSLFVAPLLRALCGRVAIAPTFAEARLVEPATGGSRVTRFLPAELRSTWKEATVRIVGWQGSGDLAANARSNVYAVLPANVESFAAGETIRVLLR